MKIYIVTHVFPPLKHTSHKRPLLLATHLAEKGNDVTVITSYIGVGNDFLEWEKALNFKVVRLRSYVAQWIFENANDWTGKIAAAFFWPDFQVLWIRYVARFLQKQNNFDRVIVHVNPRSVVAFPVFISVDSRWIIDYQDSVSPYHLQIRSKSPIKKQLKKLLPIFERRLLRKVGDAWFTSRTNAQEYIKMGLVDEGKAQVIYQFSGESKTCLPPVEKTESMNIVYAGTFDANGFRNPDIFIQALRRFMEEVPLAQGRIKLNIYGCVPRATADLIASLKMEDVVCIMSPVSFDKLLGVLRRATTLLLFCAPEHTLFLPGKLYDYLMVQRPILGVVPEGSEVADILRNTDSFPFLCYVYDEESVVETLRRLWTAFASDEIWKDYDSPRELAMEKQMGLVEQQMARPRGPNEGCA